MLETDDKEMRFFGIFMVYRHMNDRLFAYQSISLSKLKHKPFETELGLFALRLTDILLVANRCY